MLVKALAEVTGSWGNTLRLALLIISMGVTVRTLAGPIPWDHLAAAFKLGS